jgi:hypothetical protein
MGRIDVQALKVPAEFAAIFDQTRTTDTAPVKESASAPAPTATDAKPAAVTACPQCKSKVSAVEAKMGRCLTCGGSLLPANAAPASFRVGI